MDIKGIQLAGLYSLGCPELEQITITNKVELFVRGIKTTESLLASDVRGILERLDPFVFYQLIALATGEPDFFSEQVIRAHWLGGSFLRPIEKGHIHKVFANGTLKGCFEVHRLTALLMKLRGLIGCKPHHNFCVLQLLAGYKKGIPIPPPVLTSTGLCLVKPGRILSIDGDYFTVETVSLIVKEDNLLGLQTAKEIVKRGFVADRPVRQAFVSIHLGSAREIITGRDFNRLIALTRGALCFNQRER